MCGIAGVFSIKVQSRELGSKALQMARKTRHRRSDWNGIYCGESAILIRERLSIIDPQSGGQPLYSPDWKLVLAVNGEIYSHHNIHTRHAGRYGFQTGSGCEVILALYRDKGIHFLEDLDGVFAFTLCDEEEDEYLIARDPIGVVPLYIGKDSRGRIYFDGELKALEGLYDEYEPFLPGHYCHSKEEKMKRWYTRSWMDYEKVAKESGTSPYRQIHDALEEAVHRQLMSDVPYGVLPSDGLDSSAISTATKRYVAKRIETDGASDAWWPQFHSFAIGLKGAPDLAKAREVAKYIDTVHHGIGYILQEGPDTIRDIIYFIEVYDVTTVRASASMYLLARVVKSMGIKMILSDEGADGIFGGYFYFHKASDARTFHEETVRKLSKLYLYDCLRVNKGLAVWEVKGRVPFLGKEFLDVTMRLDPKVKMAPGKIIEKKVLREAFADMFPSGIAWRQKEQFSDGVGYSWIDTLREITTTAVSDDQIAHAAERFPIHPPIDKEEYYYHGIFEEHFPNEGAARSAPGIPNVACSTAEALTWGTAFRSLNDPSGRAVKGIYIEAYQKGVILIGKGCSHRTLRV